MIQRRSFNIGLLCSACGFGVPAQAHGSDIRKLPNVRIIAEGLAYPEGPVAMNDGSVIVVEMAGGCVTRVMPDGHKVLVAKVGGSPNGAAIGPDGALYVCTNNGFDRSGTPGVQRVDLATGKFAMLYTACGGEQLLAPNDLVFDETGNFWFTDIKANSIFYASPDGTRIERALTGLKSPNGIGISPNGLILYWAQTYTRQIFRRHLSAPGTLIGSPGYDILTLVRTGRADPETLLAGLPGARELDSMAIDSSGAVCVGTVLESGISVISPDGGSAELWVLPPSLQDGAVTNICFGGPDLKTAYITSSMKGRLLACDWPRPGLKLAYGS